MSTPPTLSLPPSKLAVALNKTWKPDESIRVRILGEDPYNLRTQVIEYSQKWTEGTNLKFTLVDRKDKAPTDVRISFKQGYGSWSDIGTDCRLREQEDATMNICYADGDPNSPGTKWIIAHMLGHCLGLVHQLDLPTGTDETWKKSVYDYYQITRGWKKARVDNQIFYQHPPGALRFWKQFYKQSPPANMAMTTICCGSPSSFPSPDTLFSAEETTFLRSCYPIQEKRTLEDNDTHFVVWQPQGPQFCQVLQPLDLAMKRLSDRPVPRIAVGINTVRRYKRDNNMAMLVDIVTEAYDIRNDGFKVFLGSTTSIMSVMTQLGCSWVDLTDVEEVDLQKFQLSAPKIYNQNIVKFQYAKPFRTNSLKKVTWFSKIIIPPYPDPPEPLYLGFEPPPEADYDRTTHGAFRAIMKSVHEGYWPNMDGVELGVTILTLTNIPPAGISAGASRMKYNTYYDSLNILDVARLSEGLSHIWLTWNTHTSVLWNAQERLFSISYEKDTDQISYIAFYNYWKYMT